MTEIEAWVIGILKFSAKNNVLRNAQVPILAYVIG